MQSAEIPCTALTMRRDQKLKPHGNHVSRTLNGSVELCIPFADKIMPFLFGKSVVRQLRDGTIEPIARKYIFRCTELEIERKAFRCRRFDSLAVGGDCPADCPAQPDGNRIADLFVFVQQTAFDHGLYDIKTTI